MSAANVEPTAILRTSLGDVVVQLHARHAPRTVATFIGLAKGALEWTDPAGERTTRPLYPGTVFHRVIPNFLIQGGDPRGDGTGGPGFRFPDEITRELSHDRAGVVSMANMGPDTNGSQFFITDGPAPYLDGEHTILGRVVEGLEVVRAIARVPRDALDRPVEPVLLRAVEVRT